MTKLVYGTENLAKLDWMRRTLAPLNLSFDGVKDTGVILPDIEELGNSPLENARTKAFAYYKALRRPVFSCDSGLYIEGLSNEDQPGANVRRINGKRLTDEEMIEFYSRIAKQCGGKAVARYRNAICLVMGEEEIYEYFGEDIASQAFFIVAVPHAKRTEGFPLDSLSVKIDTGEYLFDLTEKDKDKEDFEAEGFRTFFERALIRRDTVCHYDALVEENNDPVHDPGLLRKYMNQWDGKAFIRALKLSKDKSVLEIGVGTGRLAMRVCKHCARFAGIDISQKTILRAKENLKNFANITLLCGDFLTYLWEERFDVIYSSLTFLHIRDKRKAIEKVADLLRPGGRFVLSIDKNQQKEIDFGARKITVFPDDPKEIKLLLERAELLLENQFETEFAYVFAATKVATAK